MGFKGKIPALVRFTLCFLFVLILLMSAYRLMFYLHYRPQDKALSGSTFWLGLRYDARVAAIIGLIILVFGSIKVFSPFRSNINRKVWVALLTLLLIVFLVFYVADYYHYDYLMQRLNASVLNYLEDAAISMQMVWQTYPVVAVILAFFALTTFFAWRINWLIKKYSGFQLDNFKGFPKIVTYAVVFVLLAVAVFGRIGQYPLRWSDAFSIGDDFKANTALNPFQSFASSFKFKNSGFDVKETKRTYPLIAASLGLPLSDSNSLHFSRRVSFKDSFSQKPNVVIVICESFSAPKSTMFSNALNPTPFFNELCNKGLFFERCFTPAFGTARGVWATITGIPDVEYPGTASRNPLAVNQHTIINDFGGYDKYYFLGGSTTWANIRGVLNNNIHGLKIYEQENFDAKQVDVWGISDKNLFLEANDVFRQQQKPFISIIQTADNHRPYTIPKEDEGAFKKLKFPKDSLEKYSFTDNGQLNAFRYMDYCFKVFIEAAKKEKYFDNTIFVFVGDHGLRGDQGKMLPQSFTKEGFGSEHVPLLFYGEKFLAPLKVRSPASQLDVLPTVAAIARQPYTNTSLGRNLLDTVAPQNRFTFIADPDMRTKSIINEKYFYSRNLDNGRESFVSVTDDLPIVQSPVTDSIRKAMSSMADAWYHASKYLLFNNKKAK